MLQRNLPPATLVCMLACAGAATGEESAYDRLWSHSELYRDPEGVLQSLALSGRLQGEAAWFDTDVGELDDRTWRRVRFGFKAQFSDGWGAQLEGDFDLNEPHGDWYQRLTDAYVSWQPGADTTLKALKQSAGFTLDGATSSKNLLALERSNLTDNLWFSAEYFTGLSATGSMAADWSYHAGVFSTDGDEELGFLDASYFTLASVSHNWAPALGMETAEITFDYVYQEEDDKNDTQDFSDVVSLHSKWERGRWGLWTDLAAGLGYADQSDVWGASLMPFYDISERLQLVLRYTWVASDEDNGVRFGRYHKDLVTGRGDNYNELYAGVNLYLYGHKLKWQTGLQYADMSDSADDGGASEGWGFTTGLRAYW